MRKFTFSILLSLTAFLVEGQVITTIAGGGQSAYSSGSIATNVNLSPVDLTRDGLGNIYFIQEYQVLKLNPTTGNLTTFAGTGAWGNSGNGGQAVNAKLDTPTGLAADNSGNVYIVDQYGSVVRKVDLSGTINAVFSRPFWTIESIATDNNGNLYYFDAVDYKIYKRNTAGVTSVVAGNGTQGLYGENVPATTAQLQYVTGIVIDNSSNVYFTDGHRARKVDATNNYIYTVAGNGAPGFSGDAIVGNAINAQLNEPAGVSLGSSGTIYIADVSNQRIRKVDNSGTINTIAGTEVAGFSGDGSLASSAKLSGPNNIISDNLGNFYFIDGGNHRIRMISSCVLSMIPPPAEGLTVCQNSTAQELTVSATGTGSLTYQWYEQTSIISGATSAGYTPPSDIVGTRNYKVKVTGTCGSVFSPYFAVKCINGISVTQSDPSICSGTTVTLTASDASNYSWSPSTGLSSTTGSVVYATPTSTTTYTVTGTDCNGNIVTADVLITAFPSPTQFNVGGSGSFCNVASAPVSMSGSQVDVQYQLHKNGTPYGPVQMGTGAPMVWYPGSVGTYTIRAVSQNGEVCEQIMNGNAVLSASPVPTQYTISGGSFCSGGTGVNVILNGSQTGVNYQLKINGVNSGSVVAGTGAPLTWPNQTTTGTYIVYATHVTSNCTITSNGASVTVKPTVPITLSNTTQTYSGTSKPISVLTSPAGIAVAVNYNGSTTPPINAGSYSVVCTVTDPNFCGTTSGTLVVNKASLTTNANNASRIYGAINPSLPISYSGFVNGETASVIDSQPTTSTTATVTSNVGTYPITPSGGTDNNYTFSFVPGTLTINKATLIATADNTSRPYGEANPAFTISYSGFADDETASVIDSQPTASTTAVVTSNAGTYPITPAGGIDNNYSFNYINGTLTINKANQTINFNPLTNKCKNESFSVSATTNSNLPITFTSSNPAIATVSGNTVTTIVSGTVDIIASQAGNINYNEATKSQQLIINPLPIAPSVSTPIMYCQNSPVNPLVATGSNLLWYTVSSGGIGSSTAPTPSTSVAGTTSYYVSQSVNNCESPRARIDVIVNPGPTNGSISASASSICLGQSVTISSSGGDGVPYYWASSNGASSWDIFSGGYEGQSSFSFTPSQPGTYVFYVYYQNACGFCWNTNSCTTSPNVTVTVNPGPTDGIISASSTSICLGQSVTISSSGSSDTPYYWASTNGGNSWNVFAQQYGGQSSFAFTPTQPGTYRFHVRNQNACGFCWNTNTCTTYPYVDVTVNPLPTISVTPSTPTICPGSSIVLTASGASTYSWSPSTGLSATSGASVTANPTTKTTYIVTGTANGCMSSEKVTLNVLLANQPYITQTYDLCANGSATLKVNGTAGVTSYQWYRNGVLFSSGTFSTKTVYSAGSYTVKANYSNGCSSTSFSHSISPCGGPDPCDPYSMNAAGREYLPCDQQTEKGELIVSNTSIYPNPSDAELTVHLPSPAEYDMPVKMYSQYGQSIHTEVIQKGETKVVLSTKDIPSGVYIIQIKLFGQKSFNRKVAVAHNK